MGRKCMYMNKCLNGTSTLQGKHMCKIILKFVHIHRSYGPEKLIYATFKCDLDLQPT